MALYRNLDPHLWEESERNPIMFLERINYQGLEEMAADKTYMDDADLFL